MALLYLADGPYRELYDRVAIAAISISAVAILVQIVSVFLASATYRNFCREHTGFYKASPGLKQRTLYMRLPVPWPSETTYYLLDHTNMRKLFTRSPQLDAFGLARRLHYAVWGVPPIHKYRDAFREGAKQIHRELSSKKLGPVSKTFEGVVLRKIEALRNDLGLQGRPVPLHSTFYRFAYAGNMEAIFGRDLPVEETRIAVQYFALDIGTLNTTPSLPLFPRSWRNKFVPAARRGLTRREYLHGVLTKWRRDGGLETCSDAWRSIMQVVLDKNVDSASADAWANMVMFGFQGNTPEQPGWFWLYILQSPKLWQAIKAEVDSLPLGSLLGTEFRKATPMMHSAIHETLRLATATFAGREATTAATIPGCDKTFPKGSLIRIMSRASTFDAKVWGDDPESFKGDRFMKNEALYLEELLFGGGVSACPGRFFAQAELELFAAHLIRNFDFDVKSLAMHQRLPPESKYLELGSPLQNVEDTCEIIDLDGTKVVGKYPGLLDAENCMEGISGSLFPRNETTCFLRAREMQVES
ncbi:hypothetical protein LTR10_021348 [Elasticomyces elasticus]|uniref:Cytochrome P450 n=1 Tax=Exophiala sideris TaxID=1016849 RepID=A0ABR0JFM2_9EURO|nr:hypothetical protein LTR10_021348 [Elasticomyces elasticus]KAK5027526.1 hypothetical protein LTR13_009458 [Exophiala sideris]KAK5032911.1 hypothetical protein LTS07_004322 [Exophiala sideris]KAK5062435.1 hypothetical protein LTR69_004794 [Exophiala sideris]KAK5177593.1 hypothetical protein LTR44_010004 [Eurotiomycetes sp. CCFEE 6388]